MKIGAADCILGPDLGPILVLVLGSIFGPHTNKIEGPNDAPKWNPKQGPKLDPNQAPKCNPQPQICRRKQSLHDLSGLLGDRIQLCNKLTTSTKEGKGNLGGQNCSNSEHEYIHRLNIVKTCFTCKRYTVKSHAWENQKHACYYGGTPMRHRKTACFGALVLELHFAQSCGRFLLLTWGKVLAAAGTESFMALVSETTCEEKSIAGSGARAEPLEAAAQSIATGVSTVLLWLAE